MTKEKQGAGRGQEKKLRKQLQRAEAAHQRAAQQLEKRQTLLSRAEARLQRRAESLQDARQALANLVTTTGAAVATDGTGGAMNGGHEATESVEERAAAAGIIVPTTGA